MKRKVDAIRECFEGLIPGTMATMAPDGTPNIAYLSQVMFIDSEHVALSYQFFNKTRQNILGNPYASLKVGNPATAAHYLLSVRYLRTETAGPVFERMKAKLAGIASHTGMSGVFRLLGADVYHVLDIRPVASETLPQALPERNLLAATRACTERLGRCADLDGVLNEALDCLAREFGISHAMILMLDEPRAALYTVASRGYETSGVGSEIPLGQGVIGVAARERTPIRIGHMTTEYAYGRAIRQSAADSVWAGALETEIPLPGLPRPGSQLAVPIIACQRLLGVLYVESLQDLRFTYDDEDALVTVAGQLGMAMRIVQDAGDALDEPPAASRVPPPRGGAPLTVRYYAENDSIFFGDEYLIKGVAGAVFWLLARDFVEKGRTEFSNRELRLDSRLRLPDISDNLEARLVLLAKRLAERGAGIALEKTGRGRFRLDVDRPLRLLED